MKMNIQFLENIITLENGFINVIEVENKKYFFRLVNDIYNIFSEGYCDEIQFITEDNAEKNMNNKIKVFINFFNFEFDSKKYSNDIVKYVNDCIEDDDKLTLISLYNKIAKVYNKILNNIDLPLIVENEINIDNITKFMKVSISKKDDLLENLLLIIDLEKVLKTNNILFFVNLKQYLSKEELIELYKYSIYNEVFVVLIDSQSYGGTLEFEKKMIVDENLDEFVV